MNDVQAPEWELPGMPEGRWEVVEAKAHKTEAPTLVEFTARNEKDKLHTHAVACLRGRPSQIEKKLHSSILIGSNPIVGTSDPLANAPNGAQRLWYTALVQSVEGLVVRVYWFTEDRVENSSFQLGRCQNRLAEQIRGAIEGHLSNAATLRQFLKQREWLAAKIERAGTKILRTSEDLTVAKALAVMERNYRNRPLRPSSVATYCMDVHNKTWGSSDSNICFENNDPEDQGFGSLINGQHRCVVVILTGSTIEQGFAFGHHPNDIKFFDQGATRNYGDHIDIGARTQHSSGVIIEGDLDLRALPSGNVVNGILKALYHLETGKQALKANALADSALATYYDDLVWVGPFCTRAREIGGDARLFRGPHIRAVFVVVHHHFPEKADQALRAVLTNDGLTLDSPLHTLHKVITTYTNQQPKDRDLTRFVNEAFTCLRFYIEGRSLPWRNLRNIRLKRHEINATVFQIQLSEGHVLREKYKITHSFLPDVDWRAFQ